MPYNYSSEVDARIDLSIAEASKKHLHRWVGSENYPKSKTHNDALANNARKYLFKKNNGGTIWYYSDLPSVGNKFRMGNICGLTGIPWPLARIIGLRRRRLISQGILTLEEIFLSRKDR